MIKKLLRSIFSALLILMSVMLQGQKASVYDQLFYVNQEWQNQPDVDPALNKPSSVQLDEQQLIALHLQETEKLLRSRTTENLNALQLTNRAKNLNVLHQYWQAGVFPKNTMHSNRQPYFIDDFNTYCAVGYLMKMSGADEMAKAIHNTQNFNYLADIQHPDLMNWVQNSGFTFSELALIQPGYGGEWPSTIIEMHYNNVGQDVGEYIEVHKSNGGLVGMPLVNTILFYDHLGALYKTLPVAQMQNINNYGYYYQFPANESFLDSGKIILSVGSQVLSILTYNSDGITLEDNYYHTVRQFTAKEDNTTPVGSSLTFCGLYTTTWNTNILPATVSTVNPCTIGALPISLLSFNYQLQDNKVKLTWQTATELNNDHFELQRSRDGLNFTTLEKIKGAGTSNLTNSYAYTDNKPDYLNHYRLKQVDKDGSASYSKILFVKFLSANPLTVIQNPVKQTLQIQINSNQSDGGSIKIYDMLGKSVIRTVATTGSQHINVSGLAAGKYLIRLSAKDGQVYSQQFLKQ